MALEAALLSTQITNSLPCSMLFINPVALIIVKISDSFFYTNACFFDSSVQFYGTLLYFTIQKLYWEYAIVRHPFRVEYNRKSTF